MRKYSIQEHSKEDISKEKMTQINYHMIVLVSEGV